MEAWLNFAMVGSAALLLFAVCALLERRTHDALRLLAIGIPAGMMLGLLSDYVLSGIFSYVLGYGAFSLVLNAAVLYGLFTATVLLLQQVRFTRFAVWVIAMAAVYESANHAFPVWAYGVAPFPVWLMFVLAGNFATAFFIALIAHFLFGYRFHFIAAVTRE